MIEDIRVGRKDPVGEPVVSHELPDVLDRIEFRALGWQRDDGDVAGNDQSLRQMPSCLIQKQDSMRTGRNSLGNLGQMQVHRRSVTSGQNQRRPFAVPRADRTEDIGRSGALIARRCGSHAAFGPAAGDLVLLSDPGFVGEPNLYLSRLDTFVLRDLCQDGGEVFLKCSTAPAAWA